MRISKKNDERKAFYDNLYKTIVQQTQIAVKNDNSFKAVVDAQVSSQANGEQLTWSWVKQSNPAATYTKVTKLYDVLMRSIEAKRAQFFEQEKILQDIDMQHNNLIGQFPNSLINTI